MAVSQNKLVQWIDHRLPVFTYLDHELNEYPTPKNLNYWWNFGSLAGAMLMIMIATGIFLAMQYDPKDRERFVQYLQNEPMAAAQLRAASPL